MQPKLTKMGGINLQNRSYFLLADAMSYATSDHETETKNATMIGAN